MLKELSRNSQDYLKALYLEAERLGGPVGEASVSTTAVARRLSVSAASATSMLKRLDALGLVAHEAYRGAVLTERGLNVALELIRHHRLLETYLASALDVPWDLVHNEAEELEHDLSEDLEERISARLGNPAFDPHGHPIPTKDLSMPHASGTRLWDVTVGQRATVERVSDSVGEALRYLAGLGIRPGVELEVTERGPVGGPLFVTADDGDVHALSRQLAESVWVA